jgi:YaaC-like Protein
VNAGHTSHMEIVNLMKNDSLATNRIINENASVEVSIHELDREFIFLFGISTLARYRVNEWNDILSGRNNDLILKIQRYLQSVQLSFPNLILNILYDKIFLFYQPTQLS